MKKIATVLIAALLCTCLVTGCGNGSSGGTSSTASTASTADTSNDDNDSTPESTEQSEEGQPAESSQPAQESSETLTSKNYREENAEYNVENGVIVVYQDGHYRGMEMFGGGTGDAYVDSLNSLRSQLDSSIRMYSMIAPLACQYYTPANYEDATADQQAYIEENISARLDSGITAVDIVSVLGQHTTEPIYCRTDHHWMPLGAHYAAKAFAQAAGVDFKDISTYTTETIPGFVGTMYAFSGDINIKNDPEDFTYYIPDNYDQCPADFYNTSFTYKLTGTFLEKPDEIGDPQTNAYLTFFGGDEKIVKIRTNVKNGRKLLVVKDSYGNAVPSNLTNSFEEIYVVDMRYFKVNLVDFIKQLGMTDVLFTMCVFSAFGENSYGLPELLTQAQGETITDGYTGA